MLPPHLAPDARRWTTSTAPADATAFHRTLPGYAPTPLVPCPGLADELGVGAVHVKDESARLGLPAFKVLGASWACRRVLDADPTTTTLVTATDGNHGRAVARTAAELGVAATVFVPTTMREAPAAAIAAEGAEVVQVASDYDATVRRAATHAEEHDDHALVQDTAWPGYEQVPAWIVEGYATMLREIDDQLGRAPDLVAVPVGVGSLAEAVVRHHRRPGVPHPTVLAVEPDTAACLLTSLRAGERSTVPTGDTVMAGLNCGSVSSLSWPVLRDGCDAAVAVDDDAALRAVDDLAACDLVSGPSGAATLAGVRTLLDHPSARETLGLPDDAIVVLLSTEGTPP